MRKASIIFFALALRISSFNSLYSTTVTLAYDVNSFINGMNDPTYDQIWLNAPAAIPILLTDSYQINLRNTSPTTVKIIENYANTIWNINMGSGGYFNMDNASLQFANSSGTGKITMIGFMNLVGSGIQFNGTTVDFGATVNMQRSGLSHLAGINIASTTGLTFHPTLNMNGALLTYSDSLTHTMTLNVQSLNATIAVYNGTSSNSIVRLTGGDISGPYILTTLGDGTLSIEMPISFTGEMILNQSTTLALSGSGSIQNCGELNIYTAASSFDISHVTTTLSSFGYIGTNIKLLSGTGNVTLGGNYLSIGSGTYIGGISGAGGIIKTGPGLLSLSGSIPYTGDTQVSQGTLLLTSAANISSSTLVNVVGVLDIGGISTSTMTFHNFSGSGNVWLGGKNVVLSNSSALTWSGVISGSGGVTITGSGLIFSGMNSYTGTTTLASGTLTLLGSGSISSSPLNMAPGTNLDIIPVVNRIGKISSVQETTVLNLQGSGNIQLGSSYLIAQNDISTSYSGIISGSGGLIKTGAGSLTLSGVQNYTGSTTVSQGTLSLASGGSIALSSAVINNGTLDGSAVSNLALNNISGTGTLVLSSNPSDHVTVFFGSDQTYSGTIQGSASLQKTGGGKWDLENSSPYSGQIQVVGGQLVINGDIGLATVDVQPGGKLSGNGIISTLENHGAMSPGNTAGTLTVSGTYIQTGELDIEITPQGVADLLMVAGSATIEPGSTLVVKPATPGHYAEGQMFTIVQAGSPISTTFTSVTAQNGLTLRVLYNGNLIQLITTTNTDIPPVPPTDVPGNPGKTGNNLFPPGGGGGGGTGGSGGTGGGGSGGGGSGGGGSGGGSGGSSGGGGTGGGGGSGGRGTGGSGDPLGTAVDLELIKTELVTLDAQSFVQALQTITPVQISSIPVVELENNDRVVNLIQNRIYRYNDDFCATHAGLQKWTVWATPTTFWLWQKGQYDTFAFHSNTAGFVLGVENNVVENLLIGAGTGYTHSNVRWGDSAGLGYMNECYLAPYLAYRYNDLYFAGSVMGSYDAVEVKRTMSFNEIHRTAVGHFNQWNLTTMLNMQALLRLKGENFYMLPTGDIIFTQLFRQNATEMGAGALDMYYAFNFNSVMRIFLDWAAGFRLCKENRFYDFRAHVGYQNTTIFTRNGVRTMFVYYDQPSTPSFVLDGSLPSPNQGVVGASIGWHRNDNCKVQLRSDYTFGGKSQLVELDLALEYSF